jgi:hypothetical protein
MSLVTYGGKLLLSPNGKLTLGPAAAVCCCVEPGCCAPTCETLTIRVTSDPNNCVGGVGFEWTLLKISPFIWQDVGGEWVFACNESTSQWELSALACPSGTPIETPFSGQCDPFSWEYEFTVSPFDFACGCMEVGGVFQVVVECASD